MYSAIVLLPLFGAAFAGAVCLLGGSRAGHGDAHGSGSVGDRAAQWVPTLLVCATAVLSWIVFFRDIGGSAERVQLAPWLRSGELVADWALRIDTLSLVMLVVVTTVSALVHVYSVGYMSHDRHRPRFFSYLSLFTFAMLALVTSDNFLQLFFGWEGVGLASYLLIGFWYDRPAANAAAIKAFVVNRIGDFGFALGVLAVFLVFGSIQFGPVFAAAAETAGAVLAVGGYEFDALTLITLLLFVGAMGKSAQFLLHTWLPDAMEGPTPVSALIHAATMVTAGVFLVARCSPLLEHAPDTLLVITAFGAMTALFAATVGLVQNDIKRVIAYSTCSQLGYMFVAAGVGAYEVAIFHLFTHAFFKALLFLGAGSVIHAMHDEQDMRRMGGLRRRIPRTYWMMVIGTLSLTGVGVPGFLGLAGFHSKDLVVETAFAAHGAVAEFAFVATVVAAALTAFYGWRLIFLTFHGESRADAKTLDAAHESPPVMLIPLYLLAAGAVLAGAVFVAQMAGHGADHFWGDAIAHGPDNHILHDAHLVPFWVKASPTLAMLAGLAVAWMFYIRAPGLAATLAARHPDLHAFLLNKWYFDEIYEWLLVRPVKWLGRSLWRRGDGSVIDGLLHLVALRTVPALTGTAQRLQSGYLYHYAFAMVLGIAALVAWVSRGGS